MKKGLLLLSFVMLLFTTSCEDDPALFLAGTEWHQLPCLDGEISPRIGVILKFNKTTFNTTMYREYDGEQWLMDMGSGTYICDAHSITTMYDGIISTRGVVANDQMVFGLGDVRFYDDRKVVYRFRKQ